MDKEVRSECYVMSYFPMRDSDLDFKLLLLVWFRIYELLLSDEVPYL
jgi:hypothetical protein